jgi:hypothetical protein
MNPARKTTAPPFHLTAWLLLVLPVFMLVSAHPAASEIRRLKGQTVYVPVYSHIFHGDRELPSYLTVTLSLRNTDRTHSLTVVSIDYLDTDGKRLRRCLEKEVEVSPMASTSYVVKESDKYGGAGASFLVVWKSEERITEPIIETVMIGVSTQQGISFTSRGEAIEETL